MIRTALPRVKYLAQRAINTIFPPRCFLCIEMIGEAGHICMDCWQDLRFITAPQCHCCGHPFEYELPGEALCGACIQDEPPYDMARAVLCYDDASRKLVTRFKFGDMLHPAKTLASWMARAGKECLQDADYIIPVPLHHIRLVRRRYNQAAILAAAISKQSGVPLLVDAMTRTRHTTPQSGLSRRQRKINVRGAFNINPRQLNLLKNKRILLVDDVMTTGATLEACTKALKKAGAAEVRVLTLARTLLEK